MTWGLLVGITLLSLLVGEGRSFGRLAPILISAAALLKGGFVVLDFMEIGGHDTVWRRLYGGWLIIAACLLLSTGI